MNTATRKINFEGRTYEIREIREQFYTRLVIDGFDAGAIETHTGRAFAVTPVGDMILATNAIHAEQILLRIHNEEVTA